MAINYSIGQTLKLTIDSLAAGGEGIGRLDNLVCFVPFSLPGEELQVRIEKVSRNYLKARIMEIVTPSPERVAPECPVYYRCGGCQLQHMQYPAQLRAKQRIVMETMQHLGGIAAPRLKTIMAAAQSWHYRSKVQAVLDYASGPRLGLYQSHSHKVVPVTACAIQTPGNNAILTCMQAALSRDYNRQELPLRYVQLRSSAYEHKAQLTLVAGSRFKPGSLLRALSNQALNSVWLNINASTGNTILGQEWHKLSGDDYLYESLGTYVFRISPASFFQVHLQQASVLMAIVQQAAALSGNETVLDAFCGVGLFSLPLASRAARLIGIEASNSAVADARFNAAAQGFAQAQFHAAEVEALVPELLKQQQVELAVLDPPRKGCAQQVLQALADNKISRVIYVSCNMATLARDIKALTGQGYNLQWIQPVDVFPQTAHIEAVALLEYKGDNSGTGSE